MKISLIILFRLLDKELHQDLSPEQALGLNPKRQVTETARIISYKARVAFAAIFVKSLLGNMQKILRKMPNDNPNRQQ